MANNNVQNVKFLRNGSLYSSRSDARQALENNKGLGLDGSAILARYSGTTSDETYYKTLVGFIFNDGSHTSVTIYDIDDAGADVERAIDEIRTELSNKLGTGITAANSVTDQLTALSGDSNSLSSDTSVEGAKRYADEKVRAAVDGLDVSAITAPAGAFIKSVSQADGKVSATTEYMPTVGAISTEGQAITAVSQSNGTIAATAGDIAAAHVTIADAGSIITAENVEGALAEIAAEINGMDLTQVGDGNGKVIIAVSEEDGKVSASATSVSDLTLEGFEANTATTGAISSSDSIEAALNKLENKAAAITIANADGSINVSTGATGTDINVNIKSGEHVLAKDGGAGLYTNIAISAVTGTELSNLGTNVKEAFKLVGTDNTKLGEYIKIYKDSSLYSVYLGHVDDTITSATDPTVVPGTGSEALCFIYHKEDGTYELVAVNVESFLMESEFASGVTADSSTHIVHGVVDGDSEQFLTVGADGFKLDGVQDAIDTAISGLDASVSAETTSKHVSVKIDEVDGKLTAVTLTDSDIASQAKLDELSGKTLTNVTSANASVTPTIAAHTDGTKTVDLVTDASKIKMTGFTADASGFTAITTASTVTEAVKTIETEMIANEQTTSSALNDLNTRLNSEITARKAVDGQNGEEYAANSGKVYISAATSLNDADIKLNDALASLDADVIKSVKVNGVTLDKTYNAVNVQISSVHASGAASSPIVVKTDDSTGAVTLEIQYLDCGTY